MDAIVEIPQGFYLQPLRIISFVPCSDSSSRNRHFTNPKPLHELIYSPAVDRKILIEHKIPKTAISIQ